MKILIAGVGNLLRGDDAFGVVVADQLSVRANFSKQVDIYEAGIAGIAFVQQLMNGYDALIVVDAVDRGVSPGTIFVFEPEIAEIDTKSNLTDFHSSLADAHYTEPSKVLTLARALNVLPPIVFMVGCQPKNCDEFEEDLTPAVRRAIPIAIERIESLVREIQLSSDPLSVLK